MNEDLIKKVIVDNIEEGILIFDTSLNIVYANNRCKEKLGIINEEIVGENVFSLFKTVTTNDSHIVKVIETGEPLIGYYDEFITKYGKKVNLFNSTYPITENGKIIGVMDVYREMGGYHEMENRIKLLERFNKDTHHKKVRSSTADDNGTIYTIDNFIGKSQAISELKDKANKIACSDSSVLVYGETGTGKEVLVQALHNLNVNRRAFPFIAQNCAALPNTLLESILFGTEKGSFTDAENRPGLFELSNNGTLFLDEINSMQMDLQGKLLRVLEDGLIRRVGSSNVQRVNTRVITSTNESPQSILKQQKIRNDLFYRLNVIYLEIPPLRERKEDIEELVSYYIKYYNYKYNKNVEGFSNEVMDLLLDYHWPGNIRELQNIVESTVGIIKKEKRIRLESMSELFMNKLMTCSGRKSSFDTDFFSNSLNSNMENYERKLIEESIIKSGGNISAAAKLLSIPKQTLFSKIKKYNIKWNINIS